MSKQREYDGNDTTNLKLQKLLYYCQGFHLAVFDKPLFKEVIEHWDHGPVVPSVYHDFKGHGSTSLPIPDFDESVIPSNSKDLIDEVLCVYDQFSAWKLRDMTHNEAPWSETEDCDVITHDQLKKYFRTRLKTESYEQKTVNPNSCTNW